MLDSELAGYDADRVESEPRHDRDLQESSRTAPVDSLDPGESRSFGGVPA